MKPLYSCLCLVFAAVIFLLCWVWLIPAPGASIYLVPAPLEHQKRTTQALFETHWISDGTTPFAHASNIILHRDTPTAVWYGGAREGSADTRLFLSRFVAGNWSVPRVIMDAELTSAALKRPIRKLGNPALLAWPDGALGVFFVSVSMGGWAGSSINYIESEDEGQTWSQTRRLVTSPFLNISTLVRSNPIHLQDGSAQIPIYHELLGKFAESLRIARSTSPGGSLSRDIQVLGKVRMSRGRYALQPAIAPVSGRDAVALLRHSGEPPNRVLKTTSADGGMHWTRPIKLDLPNPNSSVALLSLGDGTLIAVLNDLEAHRYQLRLAVSTTGGQSWGGIRTIEQNHTSPHGHEFRFSYPSLARDNKGIIHLSYTWNQGRIKHLRFNKAWVFGQD